MLVETFSAYWLDLDLQLSQNFDKTSKCILGHFCVLCMVYYWKETELQQETLLIFETLQECVIRIHGCLVELTAHTF